MSHTQSHTCLRMHDSERHNLNEPLKRKREVAVVVCLIHQMQVFYVRKAGYCYLKAKVGTVHPTT